MKLLWLEKGQRGGSRHWMRLQDAKRTGGVFDIGKTLENGV
jgi:hypothetical protein